MKIECPRCNATGKLPQFSHINNGICFLCNGAKMIEIHDLLMDASVEVTLTYHDYRKFDGLTGRGDYLKPEQKVEHISMVVNPANGQGSTLWSKWYTVTEKNREALRRLWIHAKENGWVMQAWRPFGIVNGIMKEDKVRI